MKTIIYSAVAFIALISNLHTVFAGLDPTQLGTQAGTVPSTHTADIPKTNNDAHEAYVPGVGTEHHEEDANHSNAEPNANAHVPDHTNAHAADANAHDGEASARNAAAVPQHDNVH